MADIPAHPPFSRIGPAVPLLPVVLSVPHAGRAYSRELLASSRLPREALETLEDPLVDRLIWRALAGGAVGIVAHTPRAEIDLNRDEREMDPSMVLPPLPSRALLQSPRTRGGLGLVPSRIAGSGSIWLDRLPRSELARRVETVHRPYHQAIAAALEAARARFGIAVLLDCHSMPPRSAETTIQAGIILGDRFGASMASALVTAAAAAVSACGYRVGMNDPYAGGYVTQHHGRPAANVHALQLEIDRSFYLDRSLRAPGAGFDKVARMIATMVEALAEAALEPPVAIAAE